MIKNCFTWDFVRDCPIPTKPKTYELKKIKPDANAAKKATAFKHFSHTVASKLVIG